MQTLPFLKGLTKTSWTPTEPFYAIKYNNELHPCTYQSDAKKGKYSAFIYGTGWKESKNATLIPLFNGTDSDSFNEYLNKHGKECLFYSITGFTTTPEIK